MKLQYLTQLFTLLILLVIVLFRFCSSPARQNRVQTHTDTLVTYKVIYQTTRDTIEKENIKVSVKTDTVYIPKFIDTSKVIQDYYTKKIIQRTFSSKDSALSAKLSDTLFAGSLKGGEFSYTLRSTQIQKQLTITTVKTPVSYLAGGFVHLSQNSGWGLLITRSTAQSSYSVGYDLKNKGLQLQYSYNLSHPKK